jgi:hypothetical protein
MESPSSSQESHDSARTQLNSRVFWGGVLGAVVGWARYQEGVGNTHDGDTSPFVSVPLTVGPYILGGMLIGHLVAPC